MLKAKRIMKDEELCTCFIGIPLTKFLSIVFYCHLLKFVKFEIRYYCLKSANCAS